MNYTGMTGIHKDEQWSHDNPAWLQAITALQAVPRTMKLISTRRLESSRVTQGWTIDYDWDTNVWIIVSPVNNCNTLVPMCLDTLGQLVPKCLDTSALVPICLTDSSALVLKCPGPTCIGSEVSEHQMNPNTNPYLNPIPKPIHTAGRVYRHSPALISVDRHRGTPEQLFRHLRPRSAVLASVLLALGTCETRQPFRRLVHSLWRQLQQMINSWSQHSAFESLLNCQTEQQLLPQNNKLKPIQQIVHGPQSSTLLLLLLLLLLCAWRQWVQPVNNCQITSIDKRCGFCLCASGSCTARHYGIHSRFKKL